MTVKFNLIDSPLEGKNLIEASAGTGKTHTITGLFLRLILEKSLTVDEILVVTFTEAATAELKERIRGKLLDTVDAFHRGESRDPLIASLVKKADENKERAIRALGVAVREFDQAAIFTIHGFCRKVLHENAFESRNMFDAELVADQDDLIREIVDDFWRSHMYEASPMFVDYALANRFRPDALFRLLKNRTSRPYMTVVPLTEVEDTSPLELKLRESFGALYKGWCVSRKEVEDILLNHEGLNKVKYPKKKITGWIDSMDRYARFRGYGPVRFKGFEKFTSEELKASVKKGCDPPEHEFFELCDKHLKMGVALEEGFGRKILGLKSELFRYAEHELSSRKDERNILFFDDLLLRLKSALDEDNKGALIRSVRKTFRAAMIDEFQDTDPIQYAIFNKIFGFKEGSLFLIGDPKQAIYGFRSADIFTYMEASQNVESRYTLEYNWRSHPDLITATNTVFLSSQCPFIYDQIRFYPVSCATGKASEELVLNGKLDPPFQIWFLDPGRPVEKSLAIDMIIRAVGAEISRLLNLGREGRAVLGKGNIEEGDIAVLVRRNSEALLMQKALSSLEIPSVLHATGDLFDSREALEMERLLAGIADPGDENAVRAALTTEVMGIKGEDLAGLQEHETGWEEWLVRFRKYHDLWQGFGFIRMFRELLSRQGVLARIMGLPDGERRSTNLLHLAEVIHHTSIEKKLGVLGLLKWLSERRQGNATNHEEHPLRLESDEKAVKIVTVHKSKGLEYPIVFFPFAWEGTGVRNLKEAFMFHDEDGGMRLTLDLGSRDMDKHRVTAEKELLAEALRLLYVALTRAKNRCYLVWGRFKGAESSAPAYLFHQPELGRKDIVTEVSKRFTGLSEKEMRSDLDTLIGNAGGCADIKDLPVDPGEKCAPLPETNRPIFFKNFYGEINDLWSVSSFTSLVSGRFHVEDVLDRDETDMPGEKIEKYGSSATGDDIFSFPRGAKAGTFLHDVLEHLDFTEKEPGVMESMVSLKLDEYGFKSGWLNTICNTLRDVLKTPLDPDIPNLKLSCISKRDRLNELEFYFPLKALSPIKLKKVFQNNVGCGIPEHFPEDIGKLKFLPSEGFMKGFIDLVFRWEGRFYIVDWKSNFLGDRIENYYQDGLRAAMAKEYYILQYCIYTLALDQYLRLRVPGYDYATDFGDVFYIFLRGVNFGVSPDCGIYRDRPSPELIGELRKELL